MATNPTGRQAFTLIEILVSLVLFSFAVMVLSSAYLNVLASYEAVRQDQVLEEETRFVLSSILAIEIRDEMEDGGIIETLHAGPVNWSARLENTEVADLFLVELHLVFSGEHREKEKYRTIHLFRPGWEEPATRQELRSRTRDRLENQRNRRNGAN
ncbi:MAG: prepilin-type N-terminal cleavage/methylation domain-containing protein [Opitutales bacterium]